MSNEWYSIVNVSEIDSPALVIYRDRAKENIRLLKAMATDVKLLRPHVKTNKVPEVCEMMLDEGIRKFKCATIAEAEMLAIVRAPDVLLAYQPVGPKMQRLINLVNNYPHTRFSCLVDNEDTAVQLSRLCLENDIRLQVYIDLNVGMNRTGIQPGEAALALYIRCTGLPGIRPVGLHAYDGHINDTLFSARKERSNKAFETVFAMANDIYAATHAQPVIIAGGSPTLPVHIMEKGVECSPGTFVFWDWNYANALPDEPFQFAALVITRVISIIDKETICLDLGHKSVAAENPLPRVHFLNAPAANPVGQSEEHMVVKVADSSIYKPGDVWYGVPAHICPTVALYNKAYVVENNLVTTSWKVTARDRSINV